MRIALVAVGTQGDIQPAIALGRGLKFAGHDVRFVAAAYYGELARTAGLEPMDLNSPDPRATMATVQGETVAVSRLRRYLRILQPTGAPTSEQKARVVETCRGVDLVVSNYGLIRHPVEHLGIRYIGFGVTPVHATREFPHPLSRLGRSGAGWFNLATHRAAQRLFWSREQRWVNDWRRELGLSPERLPGVRQRLQTAPFLYGISPTVLPPPSDWPAAVRVTGYWFPSETLRWRPSAELVEFLQAGPPPVAVGFGSLVDPDPAGLRQILLAAFRAAGARGLILGGWGRDLGLGESRQVFSTDWVPYPWLLPQVSALVHHAGSGSCAQALLAGVPSVCITFSGEQWFWAGRLLSLRASTGRLSRRNLAADTLAQAIRCAQNDATIRTAATRIGAQIAREDGVTRAVAALEELTVVDSSQPPQRAGPRGPG